MEIYFYILIALTGCISIYTDIRQQRIKNLHLLIIASGALLLYLIGLMQGELEISLTLLLNPMLALIIGFILYTCGLWKAGDAKLFVTYSLLLPVNEYATIMPLACFALLLNIFLASFLCLLPLLFIDIIKNKGKIIKEVISSKALVSFGGAFLIILCISWIIQPILTLFPLKNNIFLLFVILYAGYSLLYKSLTKIKYKQILILGCMLVGFGLRYFLAPESLTLISMLHQIRRLLVYSAILYSLRNLIQFEREKATKVYFAPFMFLGMLLTQTNFLWWVMKVLSYLRR